MSINSIFRECVTEELPNGGLTKVCGPSPFTWLLILILIFGGIFWLWMLVDCITRNFKNSSDKTLWIILLIIFTLPAAIVYFFIRKNK